MKKEILISLLGILPIVVSCSSDSDEVIVDQVTEEEIVSEVEVPEVVVVEDQNPFELSDSLISQRNGLLEMKNSTSHLNWSKDIELGKWDNIEVDSNGNIVSLRIDASFVNIESNIENLTFLNILIITENPILAENGLNLSNLETLVIENDPLTFIPDWILETKSIKSISYSDSKLESIPADIDQLINLEYLTVDDGTPLTEVSVNLADLPKLIEIDFSVVSNNDLKSVPEEICELRNSGVEVLLPSETRCS